MVQLTFRMLIAKSALAHIRQLDRTLGAGIHEPVTADWVEFSSGDHLGEFFHVGGLDIDDVEALVLDIEVPQVDAEIVTADESFPVAVDGDAVDVIGVGIGVGSAGDGGHNSVVVCKAGHLEGSGILESSPGRPRKASATHRTGWSQLIRQIVLRHHLEGLVEHLPQLDSLVVCREQKV